ncbi:uromodulin-like [Protopterus annectens]|uniref:uromodulin-like n=1 Tax=Protopterus annectens TaxID=7888 RepID=UPI001CFC2901|nr:uromodulin-like [Protopterus annectens]
MKAFLALILTIGFIKHVYSQCESACLHDELCVTNDSTLPPSFYCTCNSVMYDNFNNPDFPSLLTGTPFSCHPQYFAISISLCLDRAMKMFDIQLPDDNIEDNPCFAYGNPQDGITEYVFSISSATDCQATTSINSTHVTYSVPIWFRYNNTGKFVILHNDLKIVYTCSYPLSMNTSLDMNLNPLISTNNITVTGTGTYTTIMQLYRYSDYTGVYTIADMPLSLTVETPLYIGASILSADPRLSMKVTSCYATPTSNSNDETKYNILTNDCPIPGSPGVSFKIDGNGSVVQFSFKLFKFTSSPKVYLHCIFYLCYGTCVPSCGGKSAALPKSLAETKLSAGPIALQDNASSLSASASVCFNKWQPEQFVYKFVFQHSGLFLVFLSAMANNSFENTPNALKDSNVESESMSKLSMLNDMLSQKVDLMNVRLDAVTTVQQQQQDRTVTMNSGQLMQPGQVATMQQHQQDRMVTMNSGQLTQMGLAAFNNFQPG